MSEWWSGLLKYSVQSPEWWGNVLQGTVASVLSLLGLFVVFQMTRSHELDRDRRARDAERQKVVEERTLSGVAAIMQTSLALRSAPLDNSAEVKAMSEELIMFSVREARDHPNTARWAYEQGQEIDKLGGSSHDFRAVIWQAGMVTSVLTQWVQEGRPDSMLKPQGPKKGSGKKVPATDPSVQVTRAELANPTPEVLEKMLKLSGRTMEDFTK